MILSVRSSAKYELASETFLSLMVEPMSRGESHRLVEAKLSTDPEMACTMRHDLYGNPVRHLTAPAGPFSVTFEARVEVEPNANPPEDAEEHAPGDLPPEVMIYTLPSRYCQSDMLTRMANDEFGHLEPGARRVLTVAGWVRKHVEYRYGTTDAMTSAFDTATERVGVCRDFAHLTIAFCRALGIPARYVSGYALGLDPPDFHGYAQVYLGGRWHNIDATFEGVRPALVPIAWGRDAADVAMATFWGTADLKEQTVEVNELGA